MKQLMSDFQAYKLKTESDIDSLKSINDKIAEIEKQLTDDDQKEQIEQIKTSLTDLTTVVNSPNQTTKKQKMSLTESIKEMYSSDDMVKKIDDVATSSNKSFTIKAVADMGLSTNVDNHPTIPIYGIPLYQDPKLIRMNPTSVWDALPRRTTTTNTIYSPYEADREGEPAYVSEGAKSPQIDWSWKNKNFMVEDLKAHVIVSKKMMQNIPYMESKTNELLEKRLRSKGDTALVEGDGSTPNIAGLKILGTAFSGASTGMKGKLGVLTEDNKAEILVGVITQVQKANFTPNLILLNPTDISLSRLRKDSNGAFSVPEWLLPNNNFDTIKVVPYNGLTAGEFIVMDESLAVNWIQNDVSIEIGWINDNFIKGQYAIQASLSHVLEVNPNEAGGIVYGDFTSAVTELNK